MQQAGPDRRHASASAWRRSARTRRSSIPNTAAGREQLLAYLNGRIADVRTRLPRAFATLVPGTADHQARAAVDRGRARRAAMPPPGRSTARCRANITSTCATPRNGRNSALPTLCYHEGIPGHIWQGDYANRMPLIRSMLAFNAYSEGWALYAEQLADELGVYADDPLGQLGYLQSSASARAAWSSTPAFTRCSWTRDQAIDWFVKTNGDDRGSVTERGRPLLRDAGAGVRLQGRPARDRAAARQGQGGARRASMTCAASTTRSCSAEACR